MRKARKNTSTSRPYITEYIVKTVSYNWDDELVLTYDTSLYTSTAVELYMLTHNKKALYVKLSNGTTRGLITPTNKYAYLVENCAGAHRQEFLDLLSKWRKN